MCIAELAAITVDVCVSWQAHGLDMFVGDLGYLVTPVLDIQERPFPRDFHVICQCKIRTTGSSRMYVEEGGHSADNAANITQKIGFF